MRVLVNIPGKTLTGASQSRYAFPGPKESLVYCTKKNLATRPLTRWPYLKVELDPGADGEDLHGGEAALVDGVDLRRRLVHRPVALERQAVRLCTWPMLYAIFIFGKKCVLLINQGLML
jgi:hypothetical protein